MAKNIIRTAQGKVLDFEELTLRNEKTRAVGNMGVNAAGDIIDKGNNTVATKTRRVNNAHRRRIDKKVIDSSAPSTKAVQDMAKQYSEEITAIPGIDGDDNIITEVSLSASDLVSEIAKSTKK